MTKRGVAVDLFLQALLLPDMHEIPHLLKSRQSSAISTLGWDWQGDSQATEGHPGVPKVSCSLAQPGGPSPRLRGQPLPSADGTWKCQIQTRAAPNLRGAWQSWGGTEGSGHGFSLRSARRGCSPPPTSHTQE